MPSKVYAISKPSAEIALRYGTNVSRGIKEMENTIQSLYKKFGVRHAKE